MAELWMNRAPWTCENEALFCPMQASAMFKEQVSNLKVKTQIVSGKMRCFQTWVPHQPRHLDTLQSTDEDDLVQVRNGNRRTQQDCEGPHDSTAHLQRRHTIWCLHPMAELSAVSSHQKTERGANMFTGLLFPFSGRHNKLYSREVHRTENLWVIVFFLFYYYGCIWFHLMKVALSAWYSEMAQGQRAFVAESMTWVWSPGLTW